MDKSVVGLCLIALFHMTACEGSDPGSSMDIVPETAVFPDGLAADERASDTPSDPLDNTVFDSRGLDTIPMDQQTVSIPDTLPETVSEDTAPACPQPIRKVISQVGEAEVCGSVGGLSKPSIALDSLSQPHVVADKDLPDVYIYHRINGAWSEALFATASQYQTARVHLPHIEIDPLDRALAPQAPAARWQQARKATFTWSTSTVP